MKRVIFYFVIFFIAVALSPVLIGEKGYILIAMGDYTIESTVVTAGIFLTIAFLALILSLKLFKGGIKVSTGAWHKIAFAGKRKAQKQFNQGVSAFLLGDYAEAESLLVKSAEKNIMPQASYGLAAKAAQQQSYNNNAEFYLSCLTQLPDAQSAGVEQTLVVIAQQMALKNYQKARELLDEYHKFIGHDHRMLSLEIELSLIEQHFEHVIELLPKALKEKSFTDKQLNIWISQAFSGQFSTVLNTQNADALAQYYGALNKKLKLHHETVFAYCLVLANANLTMQLEKVIIPTLNFQAEASYLNRLRQLPMSNTDNLIGLVQKHLHKQPDSIKWLSFLGFIACAGKQFDMAMKAYGSLFKIDNAFDEQDIKFFAQALIAKNELNRANQILLLLTRK